MSSSRRRGPRDDDDDGEAVYCCPNCLRIELNSYDGWLWHLGSREHQMANMKNPQAFFNPKGPRRPEILSRCVDVHGILGLKARQLLDYFKTWGAIEDFSYWYKNEGEDGLAVRCVCLYKDKDSAEACIGEDFHELDGKELEVSRYKTSTHRAGGEQMRRERGEESLKRKGGTGGSYVDYKERDYKSSRYN